MAACGSSRKIDRSRKARSIGFTLIEILVVIVIIALLVAILLPALSRARAKAQQVACAANMKGLGTAFLSFASEHQGYLPGVYGDSIAGNSTALVYPYEWKADWCFGTSTNSNMAGISTGTNLSMPYSGTIYLYVNTPKPYLCPVLPLGVLGSGVGSNGRHDYTTPQLLSGARPENMPYNAKAQDDTTPATRTTTTPMTIPTPILVEELPSAYLNNGSYDGAWCWYDHLTANHLNGSNMTAKDGSVTLVTPLKAFTLTAEEVYIKLPSGAVQDGRQDGWSFAQFNTQ